MRRGRLGPTLGTLVFLFIAPLTVGAYVPWLLSRWIVGPPLLGWAGLRWVGVVLVLLGLPVLLESFFRFAWVGRGTPAPPYPTERLVVSGFYRYVRNPMYIAVVSIVFGQGLLFGRADILIYAACVAPLFHAFVMLYEEPTLRGRYGAEYEDYCRAVRRWLPRPLKRAP